MSIEENHGKNVSFLPQCIHTTSFHRDICQLIYFPPDVIDVIMPQYSKKSLDSEERFFTSKKKCLIAFSLLDFIRMLINLQNSLCESPDQAKGPTPNFKKPPSIFEHFAEGGVFLNRQWASPPPCIERFLNHPVLYKFRQDLEFH